MALDSLYDNIEMITISLLHCGDKNLKEIQQVMTFIKVANLIKYITGQKTALAMMTKKKSLDKKQRL